MAGRVWRGRGGMVEGVSVRLAGPAPARRRAASGWGTPHSYGSPAADLKREEAELARARAAQQAPAQGAAEPDPAAPPDGGPEKPR